MGIATQWTKDTFSKKIREGHYKKTIYLPSARRNEFFQWQRYVWLARKQDFVVKKAFAAFTYIIFAKGLWQFFSMTLRERQKLSKISKKKYMTMSKKGKIKTKTENYAQLIIQNPVRIFDFSSKGSQKIHEYFTKIESLYTVLGSFHYLITSYKVNL